MVDQNQKEESNQNLAILPALKIIITEWFQSSTSHGLPNIFRTSSIILKIFWTISFLTSTGACMYFLINTLTDYYTYPSYISTKINQVKSAEFPAITICNIKTINSSKAFSYLSQTLINPIMLYILNSPMEFMLNQNYFTKAIVNNDKNLTYTSRKSIGYDLSDMLVSCYFNYKPCYLSDFTYYYDTLKGNCYTFNKGLFDNGTSYDTKNVSLAGLYYGLNLELYVSNPSVDTLYEMNDGIYVSIHNQSSIPFSNGELLKAQVGAETDFIMSRNFVTKLEAPHGNCLKDISESSSFSSFSFDYIVKTLKKTYTRNYCYSLCTQKSIMESCNCTNAFLPVFNGSNNFCINFPEVMCVQNLVNTFSSTQYATNCVTDCPYECDYIEYSVNSYKSSFPNDFYKNILYQNKNLQSVNISLADASKAFLKVNFYYKGMEYSTTEQIISTTATDLLSNIGGTLGLYIGISLLSFVEVIELIFSILIALIGHLKTKKQRIENIDIQNFKSTSAIMVREKNV